MEEQLIELIKQVMALAPEVWNIALKQVTVDAYSNLGVVLLLLINLVLALLSLRKYLSTRGDDPEGYIAWVFGSAIILLVYIMIVGNGILTAFLNPEYAAMLKLLDLVGY